MDCEEALKISGQENIESAVMYFISSGVPSFIITNGPENLYAFSEGGIFRKMNLESLPVSQKVVSQLKSEPGIKGDTTGCGDNFTGGIIASLAWQLKKWPGEQLDLAEAISWGVASGGFACFYVGGTYIEKNKGEKLKRIEELQKEYLKQTGK